MNDVVTACSDTAVWDLLIDYLNTDWCPTTPDAATCATYVSDFMPYAIPVLLDVFSTEADRFCGDIWGVC